MHHLRVTLDAHVRLNNILMHVPRTNLASFGDRWPVTGDRWPVTGDRWPVTGDRWPLTADRWPVTADRWPLTADRWPLTADRWPLTADRWPLTADRWPLTADRWPLTGHFMWLDFFYKIHCPLLSNAAEVCRRSDRHKRRTCTKMITADILNIPSHLRTFY